MTLLFIVSQYLWCLLLWIKIIIINYYYDKFWRNNSVYYNSNSIFLLYWFNICYTTNINSRTYPTHTCASGDDVLDKQKSKPNSFQAPCWLTTTVSGLRQQCTTFTDWCRNCRPSHTCQRGGTRLVQMPEGRYRAGTAVSSEQVSNCNNVYRIIVN